MHELAVHQALDVPEDCVVFELRRDFIQTVPQRGQGGPKLLRALTVWIEPPQLVLHQQSMLDRGIEVLAGERAQQRTENGAGVPAAEREPRRFRQL